MAEPAFPLALPTKDQELVQRGIAGGESLTARTGRNLAEKKAAEAAAAQPDQFQAARDAQAAEQERLEAEHGKIATAGTQFARDLVGLVVSPGALGGAGIESLGELTGVDRLRDFGRAVGQASTPDNVVGSFGAAQAAIFGNGDTGAGYSKAQQIVDEQAKAWPLLTTISRGAGMLAGTALTAGIGGEAKVATIGQQMLSAGVQGAGMGAQQQYEQNAPLRDVLTSAVIGGAFAAGTAGVLGAGQKWLSSPSAREAFEDVANERAGAAIGFTKAQIKKMGADEAKEVGANIAGHTLDNGEKVLPDDLIGAFTEGKADIAPRILQGQQEIGEKLGAIRQAAGEYIDTKAPELRPNVTALVQEMRDRYVSKIEASPILRSRATQLNNVIEELEGKASEDGTIGLSALRETQDALKSIYKGPYNPEVAAAKTELKGLERMIDAEITKAVDKVAPDIGVDAAKYGRFKQLYGSFNKAAESIEEAQAGAHGNNFVPLTSQLTGLAEYAHAGGGLVAGVKGAAAAALHKYVRNQGSTIIQYGARKLAEGAPELAEALAPASVSVAAAGGREAAQVINFLSRSRAAVADAVEQAGPNPDLRAVAQQDAADEQARSLHEAAGQFHPASVFEQTPTAIQKVVFRGPILDHVSQDIAGHVQQAMRLAPDADLQLDPARVSRLTRDVDGSAAIGRLQSRVQDIFNTAPPTLFGDQMQALAGQTRGAMSTADVPQAIALAHDLAEGLRSFSAHARDQVSQDFALRGADGLHDDLTSDDMGEFGQLYGKAFPGAPDKFAALADPANVRETLRTAKERGALPAAMREFADRVSAAHDARESLSGEQPDEGANEQLKALQKRAAKAEAAVTLDGGPIGRVLDHFDDPAVPAQDLDTLVTRTVSDHIQRLIPHLKGDRDAIDEEKPPPKQTLTAEAQQAQYKDRLGQISQAVADPMGGKLAAGLYGHPNIPPDVATVVGSDAAQRAAQLLQDMPKPAPSIRGKAFETLSSDDVRRGNAMWEATMKPLSLFDDFRRGAIDYDKVQYTWKQYPGLQQAAQMGLLDALHGHLDDSERERIPDQVLTQLDYLLAFGGKLQGSLDPAFSGRMTAIYQAQQQQQAPQQGAPLNLPGAKPTFTEKMMGNRG